MLDNLTDVKLEQIIQEQENKLREAQSLQATRLKAQVITLEQTITSLNSQISDLSSANKTLESTVAEMKLCASQAIAVGEEAEKRLLTVERDSLLTREAFESSITSLKRDKAELQRFVSKLEGNIADLNRQIEEKCLASREMEKQHSLRLKSDETKYEESLHRLQKKISALEEANSALPNLKVEINALQNKLQLAEGEVIRIKQEKVELENLSKTQIESKAQEEQNFRETLKDLKKKYKERINLIQTEFEDKVLGMSIDYKRDLNTLEEELKTLKEERGSLKSEVVSLSLSLETERKAFKTAELRRDKDEEALTEKVKKLSLERETFAVERGELLSGMEKLQAKILLAESQILDLEKERKLLICKLANMKQFPVLAEREPPRAASFHPEQSEVIEFNMPGELKSELRQLEVGPSQKKVEELEKNLERCAEIIDTMKNEMRQLSAKTAEISAAKDLLASENAKISAENAKLSAQIPQLEILRSQIELLRAQLTEREKTQNRSEKQAEEIESLRQELEASKIEKDDLLDTLSSMKARLRKLEPFSDLLKHKESGMILKELSARVETLLHEKNDLLDQLKAVNEENNRLRLFYERKTFIKPALRAKSRGESHRVISQVEEEDIFPAKPIFVRNFNDKNDKFLE